VAVVDIVAAGEAGSHTLRRVNVNTEEDYIYFRNGSQTNLPESMPAGITDTTAFIYSDGVGSVSGLTTGDLVYARVELDQVLQFSSTVDGEFIDLGNYTSGTINFNTPVVEQNILNINASTVSNQAVKYYTNGTPITGLVSGNTYFLKNISADFAGQQPLYTLVGDAHTFTTCGRTGRLGPNAAQILAGYSTTWHSTYLSRGDFDGYQDWTVPVSGVYQFDVQGAAGFDGTGTFSRTINQTSLTGNVATIRTTTAHELKVGMSVTISSATNTVYNGTYTVTSIVSATEFSFARTNANISTAASAGTVAGDTVAGRGARVRGKVALTKGEIITIAVGQVGENAVTGGTWGGSGGGTFVVRKTGNEPLFIAGGGSASSNTSSGLDGVLTSNGGFSQTSLPGGVNGDGGPSTGGFSAGGGGFFSRGQNTGSAKGGGSFLEGLFTEIRDGRTGQFGDNVGGLGGFGGGAMSDGNRAGQSGGGGGYSGGAGSRTPTAARSGGGGGSFIISSATEVATSNGTYNTLSTFGGVAITNLSSFNTGEGSVALTLVESFTTGNTVHPTAADANAGTNAIAIEPAGTSYHSVVPINFDIQNDQVHSPTAHGLTNGGAITFTFDSTPPAGLFPDTIYYVNNVNAYSYRLSSTPSPSFTTLNLTTPSASSDGDIVRRVVVNTATDTLTITNHGFLVDQPVQYFAGEDGTPILPLQNNVTYYVAEVVSANQITLKTSLDAPLPINFTAAGTGTSHSFIFVTVNALEDTLYIPNHGLVSGQTVKYSNGGNTTIPGLTNNAQYFIERVDNSIIKLATNKALTQFANITGPGSGTQSLVITSLDYANNIITVPGHGFLAGELIQYDSRGQTVVDGLTTATPYYVIFIDGDNIKLAETPEDAEEGTAVDITDTPAGVGVHALTSLSKTPDGIYEINSIPSPTTFTVLAKGNVPPILKTFNPRSSVDTNLNVFKIPSHGFITGTKVLYSNGEAGTDIDGLTDNTEYFVVSVNRDYLRLAETAEDAASGVTLTVDDFGTGVGHTFTTDQINGNITGGGSVTVAAGSVLVNGAGTSFSKILKVGDRFRLFPPNTTINSVFGASNVSTITEIITFPSAHGFVTTDAVVFSAGGGVSPSPLVDGYYYFVRRISNTELTLHSSASDATSNLNPVDFSTAGTGTAFSLTKTTPVSPIIRRITAIGSDTQITVDRPYANAYNAVSYSFPTFLYVRPQGYSLHRPFDGGVEMSAGAGTSLATIVRQTRKYFRYQSGKGIQTSCGINFKPSIDLETMTKFSNTTIQCTTRRPHGLVSGLFIQVSQATDSFGDESSVYNGVFQVTVVDLTTFRMAAAEPIVETRAYGFPQFYVREWQNGAVRTGMFDFQNGAFFEFDGQKLYAVRRSSTQQLAGTVSVLQGSELVFGDNTSFEAQLDVGDYIVMRGQSYRIVELESDTRMSIRPEYKGASGVEKEFNPGNGTTGVVRLSTDVFQLTGHGFSQTLPVVYNSIDGEAIGGLVNGRTYYIDLIDNNSFKLLASPDAESNVSISSVGTTAVHSFTPAKSGIVVTKTVDTRVPQEDFSIDPCDGSGPTGYNLDLSRIQMAYIDYSWYGAGKIRFGFKTSDGQVQYVHEYVHNNNLYESYFRSGNLPARYEVVTYLNPTYIPFLFHWGTSVMMDGRFDDDNAYLFTATSQTLDVPGTTPKAFASTGINLSTDLFTVKTHGFRTGDMVQFQSIASNGFPGDNELNPATQVVGSQTLANLTNSSRYKVFVNSPSLIHLTPETATITLGATISRSAGTVTVVTATPHDIPESNNVGIYGLPTVTNIPAFYVGPVTVTNSTTFTFPATGSFTVASTPAPNAAIAEVLNFTTQGNTQYTYFLYPDGSLNNTSGPNYQPLISLRLSPSVSEGLTGKLGDRDVINRMQLRLQEIGVSTTQLVDVKVLLNPRLNNLNFTGVDSPSLTQVVEHTSADTVSGGIQVYNFRAAGGDAGSEGSTTVDVSTLFELSNSVLGGDAIYPDGPDILTIAVSRLTGNETLTAAKLSWAEAQA
jgi:hypothetical protein